MRTKEEVRQELALVESKIRDLCFNSFQAENKKNEYWSLKDISEGLRDELRFFEFKIIATDEELDIYENPIERSNKKYHITLHGIPREIGLIEICYDTTVVRSRGHIGYEMDERYRGNSYMSKALELLVDEMLSRNLDNPTLAVYPSNIPSIRTVEKFGGEIIHEAQNRFDWNIYRVDLKSKKQIKILTK